MQQQGFSTVVLLIIGAVLIGAGGVTFMLTQSSDRGAVVQEMASESEAEETATSATTSAPKVAKSAVTPGKKSKVRICDILTISKISSMTGVQMRYTPDLTEDRMAYEDGDIWNSICAFYEDGSTTRSAGVSVFVTEALSAQAKDELEELFESEMAAAGGVPIEGFGDKAYVLKYNEYDTIASNQYNVLLGNIWIVASSGIGFGNWPPGVPLYEITIDYTESTDALTEEILNFIIPQLQ